MSSPPPSGGKEKSKLSYDGIGNPIQIGNAEIDGTDVQLLWKGRKLESYTFSEMYGFDEDIGFLVYKIKQNWETRGVDQMRNAFETPPSFSFLGDCRVGKMRIV